MISITTFRLTRPWFGSTASAILITSWLVTLAHAQAEVQETRTDQNDLKGFDYRLHYQKKLLEFVSPIYKTPLVHDQLITGLASPRPGSTAAQKLAADRIASYGASMVELERHSRLTEQAMKIQLLKQQGISSPGANALTRAGAIGAKVLETRAAIELMSAKLDEYKAKVETANQLRLQQKMARVESVKSSTIRPVVAKSGRGINILLDALRGAPLDHVSLYAIDDQSRSLLESQMISSSDLQQLRLQLDDAGTPVIFSALERPASVDGIPVALQHPELKQLLDDYEKAFARLQQAPKDQLYDRLQALRSKLDSIERKSDEIIGTAQECARKGDHAYRIYQTARDYRRRLQGMLERVELTGSTSHVGAIAEKLDPDKELHSTLTIVRLILDNGYRVAPAEVGGEQAYARFQRQLMLIEAVMHDGDG